ncbi:helix-turn-helix domain-containing protein [Nocardia sp. NPDC004068]|uniref:helix-turn-helix domain-containing protein n=1 Tax=Nocardia sp. NPDC004068 TaxID=3364303 RepID=UPI0036CC788D
MGAVGSTLARRALGRQLHVLRKKAGFSQGQAAGVLGVSTQTMGRLEEGVAARATDLYMNALCDKYKVTDEKRRMILHLAKEVRTIKRNGGGWWRADADREPDAFDPRAVLEDTAVRLTAWGTMLLPNIVRTVDYCRAVVWTESPNLPSDQVELRVDDAMRQRRRLDDDSFTARIFLSEAAIREELGGPGVMAEQRRHLAELGRRPNVSVRIVPFNCRNHIGALVNPFSLMEFPMLPQSKLTELPVVYLEEYVGDLYLERSEEVDRYKAVTTELHRVALDEDDSRKLITRS